MQINELLLKNFGKFHDRQIDLDEGINLIHGENESGKSTIHTFIRGMLFGIERGRGRAAQNDTFSIYEPWENPNYYSGILKFKSGEKHFRIERNFDKYSKKAELICEEDGGRAEKLCDKLLHLGKRRNRPGRCIGTVKGQEEDPGK